MKQTYYISTSVTLAIYSRTATIVHQTMDSVADCLDGAYRGKGAPQNLEGQIEPLERGTKWKALDSPSR